MVEDCLARGPRTAIRKLRRTDREEFVRRAAESTAVHRPWLFPPTDDDAFDAYLDRLDGADREGFAICLPDEGGAMAGYASINNIVRGAFRCGAVGYGGFAAFAGRGLVAEGVGLVVRHALGPMGLHRLEANVQPGNARSVALVRRLGFRLEGLSPDFLFVDGAWRDHERWAITAEMVGGGAGNAP